MNSIRNIIITFFIGCFIFVIGNALSDGFAFNTVREFLIEFSFYQLYAFVLGYSNMFYFGYLEQRQWGENDRVKRIIIGISGSIVLTLMGLFLLRLFTALYYNGQTLDYFITHETLKPYQFGLWVTLTIVVTFHVVYFYSQYQQKKIKEQKVIAGTASAKFDALKNQLDPHFLFNSLNVLSSLIEENTDNALKFTTSLSKVYRYVLEQKNKDLVTVDEELEFAKTYMSLLKMRFEDSIIFEIPEKATDPESKVVPLSLQLLLENAVKHNMVTASSPLYVKVHEFENQLIVENNLQPKQIVKKSSGVGLSNIKQRYDLLTNRKVIINQQAKRFAVAIPMLTKQITVMRKVETHSEHNYERARRHVESLKGFYYSIISYCIVIPFIIFINYKTSWGFHWFWFPVFGWGIGICIHAYQVFVNDGVLGRNWEERKIEQYMKEDENKKWN